MAHPIFKAVSRGDLDAYQTLIDSDPTLVDAVLMLPASGPRHARRLTTTPLHKALGEFKFYATHDRRRPEHLTIAEDLISRGASPEARGSQLHVAASQSAALAGNNAGFELARTRNGPWDAACAGDLGAIDASASDIDQPDENGLTPLMLCSASRLGRTDERVESALGQTAAALLARGADPARYWPGCFGSRESHLLPTSFAAMGNAAVLRVLLAHDAPTSLDESPGANGHALAHATWSRSTECLCILLEHLSGGADGTAGYTPFHWIARTNYPESAASFAEFIASKRFVNPRAVDEEGAPASAIAERAGHRALARALAKLEDPHV